MSERVLTVVEDHINLPPHTEDVFLWDSFEESPGVCSIPRLVEEQVTVLKAEYLNWTATLAFSSIDGSTLAEHFSSDLLNGGSYWWQTLIADKSPYKTKAVYDVLRVRVVEKQFIAGGYRKLVYIGTNKQLAKVFQKWLQHTGCAFSWITKKQQKKSVAASERLYNVLPLFLQAVIYIGYIILKRLRFSKHVQPDTDAMCTIVTYFPGIDLEKVKQGEFYSNYWGPLHDLLKQEKIAVNWIWMYSNMRQLSYKESVVFQSSLNKPGVKVAGRYLLMEDFLDFRSFWKGIGYYVTLLSRQSFYKKLVPFFTFPGSTLNFFPILKNDWKESFIGHTAIVNCTQMAVFDQVAKKLPRETKLILYVWENQPWEQCLLAIRENLANAFFVGSVHTPANCAVYNLKVFPGNASEIGQAKTGRLMPDVLAAPGDKSNAMLIAGGWPADRVQTFEALRYINSLKPLSFHPLNEGGERNLLVVTGSIQNETEIQIELLSLAEKKGALRNFSKVIIKPHPLIPVEALVQKARFQIQHEIVFQPLSELWSKSHVVYTSNSTSVSLEAAYHGIPVIIVGASGNLNINTLFGADDVEFIHSVDELCKKISLIPAAVNPKRDFFELNPALPRWAKLFRDHGFQLTGN